MTDQPPAPTPPSGPGGSDPSDPTVQYRSSGAAGDTPSELRPGVPPAGPPPGWDPAQDAWGPPPPGWTFPAAGGHPPGSGPHGALPWYPGAPVGWYPPGYGFDPNDPLVTPPGAGLAGWFTRCGGAFRRGWRQLVPIMLLTQVLPAAVLSVIALGLTPTATWDAQIGADPTPVLRDTFAADLAGLLAVAIGGSLLVGLVQAVGWAAGSWVIAQQASGQPGSLDSALRYGVRRALRLWGWTLLIGVIAGIGFCCCVLPGIYLTFALSMAGPVYLFERHNPIGRSFRMFHDRLGLLLGRVALVALAVIVVNVLTGGLEEVGIAALGTDPFTSPGTAVGAVAVIGVTAVLALPAHLAQLIGLLVTYVEQRAHEAPVNTAGLAAELG
ncbi:hypothetical protein [Micromonospora sp. NPDC048839]|uniref:hypothetical protein n=1 Tax=Micromonospora sp. NPDC048839 TaxID=3155641 RepID=UPI00341076F5